MCRRKAKLFTYIQGFTSQDDNFEYSYPPIDHTGKDGRELVVEPDLSHVRRRSNPSETEIKAVTETNAARVTLKDHSQSAKSSPQKQVRDMKRQRAHSDTSLNKVRA